MGPEAPFLAAGAIAIAGGVAREKTWPKEGARAVIGTLALTLVASAAGNTRFAPLVRAVGLLVLLVSVMATVTNIRESKKKG